MSGSFFDIEASCGLTTLRRPWIAATCRGSPADNLLFWGHQPPPAGGVGKGCLSQWWPTEFTVGGVAYASAEHYMMSAKAMLFGDAEMAGQIRRAPHPGAAKALGRQVRGFDDQRWADRRF
jgi:ribA/ribD-fused uncharacterized protein